METKEKKRKTAIGSKWKSSNTSPLPNPDIILIFHGLMAVSQKNINKIDFTCHGLEDKHELKIIIGKWESGAFRQIERIEQPSKIIKFTTTNVQSEIKVFSKNLERKSFDWIVDIEREHQRKLDRITTRFPHTISVNEGLLYTYARTSAEFVLKNIRDEIIMDPRGIASLLAVNIYLQPNKTGKLSGFLTNFEKPGNPAEPHIIIFDNVCEEATGGRCHWYPESPSPEGRNDFFLNYKNVIDRESSGVDELFLMITNDGSTGTILFGEYDVRPILGERGTREKRVANRAPCAAVGYGETGD